MKKISSIEAVRRLAVQLEAVFDEGTDRGYLSFDNDYGKGSVKAINIFFGLEVVSFDLYVNKPFSFEYFNLADAYLHCIFIQEGFLQHSFNKSEKATDASRFQNVIVGSRSEDYTSLKLPEKTKLRFVVITLEKLQGINDNDRRGKLQILLDEVMDSLSVDNSYSYFGNFSNQASGFVNTIINSVPNSLTNRLIIEASVLNTLSCQFLAHENNKEEDENSWEMTKSEILNVIQISEFIANNLHKQLKLTHLERESGLNQKRIQKGFKHFFGMSVNKYILNLRILKAKELIETTDLSISEIVYNIGLNSRSYFSRIFSDKYGLLPNEYRKNFKIHNPTFELSYYSTANVDLGKSYFEGILLESRKNNTENKISGCLIYHKDHFFQILEGPKEAVLKTYDRIRNDRRHKNLIKLYDGYKSGRTFDEWNMAFLEKPSMFSDSSLTNFRLMNIELILKVDNNGQKDDSNKLRTKLMWERARNTLLVTENISEEL